MTGFLSRIRSANLSEGSNKSPEQYLWTAVLSTAMYDAIVRKVGAVAGKINLDVEATVDAIIWVLDYDENFKSDLKEILKSFEDDLISPVKGLINKLFNCCYNYDIKGVK